MAKRPRPRATPAPPPPLDDEKLEPPDHDVAPLLALTHDQFTALLSAIHATPTSQHTPALDATIRALELQAEAAKKLGDEFGRQVRRSNRANLDDRDPLSVDPTCAICQAHGLHPETESRRHPRPPFLFQDVYFCGGRLRLDQLTPTEIELINAFAAPEFESGVEARDGKWTATIVRTGKTRTLHLTVPAFGIDDLMSLPTDFTTILSELLYGAKIVNPVMALAAITALQKQVDALTAQLAAQ